MWFIVLVVIVVVFIMILKSDTKTNNKMETFHELTRIVTIFFRATGIPYKYEFVEGKNITEQNILSKAGSHAGIRAFLEDGAYYKGDNFLIIIPMRPYLNTHWGTYYNSLKTHTDFVSHYFPAGHPFACSAVILCTPETSPVIFEAIIKEIEATPQQSS